MLIRTASGTPIAFAAAHDHAQIMHSISISTLFMHAVQNFYLEFSVLNVNGVPVTFHKFKRFSAHANLYKNDERPIS